MLLFIDKSVSEVHFGLGYTSRVSIRVTAWENNDVYILTPDDVGDGADEQVGAALLHPATVWVIVHVSHRLPGTQSAQNEILAIRVYHIHELCVRRVQPRFWVLVLEQWSGRVQPRDSAQVLQLGAGVSGRVRTQTEADQVHIFDGQIRLGCQTRDEHGHLFADQSGVGRGPHVVGYYGTSLPVHADHVAVDLNRQNKKNKYAINIV